MGVFLQVRGLTLKQVLCGRIIFHCLTTPHTPKYINIVSDNTTSPR